MGYQALLFCPDDKLASVVSQVFSELDFTIDAVHEPFAAVKKLMSQRYDAIVVDSENEQNASLLFKSARNSSSNQSSLAIALVEGQMGVAKAYRIGANLVLTKPINVEQAKGTLRVARGLLRKNSDAAAASAATAAMPARTAAAPASSYQPLSRNADTIAPPPRQGEPKVEPALPEMVAEVKPESFPAEAAPLQIAIAHEPAVEAATRATASVPAQKTNPRFASTFGSVGTAAASAPAKDLTAAPARINRIVESNATEAKIAQAKIVQAKIVEAKPAEAKVIEPPSAAFHATDDDVNETVAAPTFSSMSASDAPSFAGLGDADSEASGGKKKIMIAGVVILALAALGYVGYETISKPAPNAQPVSAPQDSGQPALRPMSSPVPPTPAPAPSSSPVASAMTPGRVNAESAIPVPKNAAAAPREKPSAGAAVSPAIRIAPEGAANSSADSEFAAKKTDSAPLRVKSSVNKKQSATDESAPQLSSELALAPASGSNLTSLISSSAPALPKAPLATIRVSQGVSQGLLIKRVTPQYPHAALAIHAQGAVQIEATINKEGVVVNPKVLSGDPVLAQAAIEAVRQWRYKPYYLDGEPVEIKTQITVNFKTN